MASIKKNGKKWVAEVRRKGGFYKSKTWPTRKQASQWAAKIETELELSEQGLINTIKTFGDAVERYMAEVSPNKRSHRWETIRAKALKNTKLYNIYMSKICANDIANYRDERLAKKLKTSTVIRELGFISAIFNIAKKEWGWITFNPVSAIAKPQPPKPRTRRISQEEIDQLMAALDFIPGKKITLKMHQVAVLFLLAVETAMRTSEMTSLEWEQVDLDGRCVHLKQTKNGDDREVPLSKRALELLKCMIGTNKYKVFTVSSSVVDGTFRKAKKRAKITDLHFHDTRREAASRLAKKLDVMDLAKMTGHRDLKMLLNVYYKPKASDIADLLD